MSDKTPPRQVSPAMAWAGLLASWLIPGGGFFLCGRGRRGAVHFVTIMLTFMIGLSLHSSVAWPSWDFKSEEFNLINNFTFVVQMGSGLPALASLWAATQPGAGHDGGAQGFLGGIPEHPYYELGAYFLIVAGALNYFAVGNLYDRLVRLHPRFRAEELGEEEDPS